jgi:hypothetical protein
MERVHRRGAEFSKPTRTQVYEAARGRCMHPDGCDMPHNGRLDHITSCLIGWHLGMSPASLRHVDNAQILCELHDAEKTYVLEPAALESLQATIRGSARLNRNLDIRP